MYQAYIEGKDLYAMIAQSAFDNEYWENLEFYPEGTEIELDGKKIICGHKTNLNKAGKERRSVGKVLLLASTYGMSGATAGARMGKTKEEGQALLDKFFNKYTKVRDAIDYSQGLLKEKGYVEDWAGRRRNLAETMSLPNYEIKLKDASKESTFNPIIGCSDRTEQNPDLLTWSKIKDAYIKRSQEWQRTQALKEGHDWKENNEMSNKAYEWLAKVAANPIYEGNQVTGKAKMKNKDKIYKDTGINMPTTPVIIQSWTGKKAKAMRQCFNARIQGGAASLTKLAMIKINNDELMNKWDAHLIITVHDEVLVECPEQYAELVEERLPKLMVDAAKENGIDIPMKCDPYNVNHWYIDEFTVSVQDEFKKLEAKGLARDEAMNKVIKNHSELSPESIRNTIETGAEIVL